jgi:L-aminopeptidase/D-esterase-like protein
MQAVQPARQPATDRNRSHAGWYNRPVAPAASQPPVVLPEGVRVGHFTDREGWTGCTVVLPPPDTVAAGEVRGGGPGTRESDVLSPATSAPGVQAVLFTGGSAYGLAAADGVMAFLAERGHGHPTPAGLVPLVPAAVVFDLPLGDPGAHPDAAAGHAACAAAGPEAEEGSVGAGTGCTVGKLLGPEAWTKGGLALAGAEAAGARVCALAVANAFGDVLDDDGSPLAGVWQDGAYRRTVDLLAAGVRPEVSARESTTLVCLITDAALSKTEAWLAARAASAGVARAVDPTATAVDGDVVYCLATGQVSVQPDDLLAVWAVGARVTAQAIRRAVRLASAAPGCPTATERRGNASAAANH